MTTIYGLIEAESTMQQTPNSPTFEESLIGIATEGWEEAIADYFYPGLAKPKLVFDPTRTAGFFIDTQEWRVTMNLLQVPTFISDEDTRAYIRGISQHEIGHYDLCPYDGLLDAKLLSAAMKGVPEYFAPLVVNIFADLVIDTTLFQRFPDLTVWRTQEAIKDVLAHEPTSQHGASLSSTWKLLIKAYEQFWNVDLGIASIDCSVEQAKARRLAAIVAPELLDKESWPAKVKKIADLLKPTLEQDFTLQVGVRAGGGGGGASGDAGLQGPEDYERQFGDPSENKSREKVQGKSPAGSEADLERFAKGRGFKEF
ncbi:MAG TPA: hypothetical protein VKK79_11325, partial [Candidatus Lokiarchaeia archaeon]|nr:hypothetical protein [Candidatus Lokiarchaeia archaeon]